MITRRFGIFGISVHCSLPYAWVNRSPRLYAIILLEHVCNRLKQERYHSGGLTEHRRRSQLDPDSPDHEQLSIRPAVAYFFPYSSEYTIPIGIQTHHTLFKVDDLSQVTGQLSPHSVQLLRFIL